MKNLSKIYQWLLQPILVIGILIFGFLGARSFSMFEDEPQQTERETYAPLVRVITTQTSTHPVTINGNGTLEAYTRINLVPQVGGRISYIHPNLRAGGSFAANEVLIQIEKIDFELAITQNEAQVAVAHTALDLEIAQAQAARAEWQALNPDTSIPKLVGREPQIAEARAQLKSSQALLEQARLALKRSSVRIPFSGRVVQASIDIGEVVSANQQVGIVYSKEKFEIPVPLNVDDLAWIDLPNKQAGTQGSEVDIHISIGKQNYILPGRVTRIESELEQLSRFARIVVTLLPNEIPNEIKEKIIPGLFLNVSIHGKQLEKVTTIPRIALREDNMVWAVKDGKLRFMQANIVYISEQEIIVRDVPENTQLVISNLDVVTDDMDVRVSGDT